MSLYPNRINGRGELYSSVDFPHKNWKKKMVKVNKSVTN